MLHSPSSTNSDLGRLEFAPSSLAMLNGVTTKPKAADGFRYDRYRARFTEDGKLHLNWLKEKSDIPYRTVQELRRAKKR